MSFSASHTQHEQAEQPAARLNWSFATSVSPRRHISRQTVTKGRQQGGSAVSAAAPGPGAHASTHWSQGCLGEHVQLRIAPPSPEAPLRVPILAAKRLTGCCAPPGVRAASALRAASQRTQDLHRAGASRTEGGKAVLKRRRYVGWVHQGFRAVGPWADAECHCEAEIQSLVV